MDSEHGASPPLLSLIAPHAPIRPPRALVGLVPGEGIGPELCAVVADVLAALAEAGAPELELRPGGVIGRTAQESHNAALTEDVVRCADVVAAGGALLTGPAGGRFVYDLRSRFDLYCKLVPIRPWPELADVGCLRPDRLAGVDILVGRARERRRRLPGTVAGGQRERPAPRRAHLRL
jgi:3-isopropylmalate dehydrogenase